MDTHWRQEALRLAQQAQEHLSAGEVTPATECIDTALSLVDQNDGEVDVVFAAILIAAADIATSCEDVESGAALYNRATEVCGKLNDEQARGTNVEPLLGRALLGLARADVDRGYDERARERYQAALAQMQNCDPPPPRELLDVVRSEMTALRGVAVHNGRKPWWKVW